MKMTPQPLASPSVSIRFKKLFPLEAKDQKKFKVSLAVLQASMKGDDPIISFLI